jgi:ectoine hydroxylase-related dioxygenase (phytanoyl-CoA dioxygenase family)
MSDTSDSDDDPLESFISLEDGLSHEALSALLHFQSSGFFEPDSDSIIPKNTACATYTAKDSQVISETYRRLQAKEDVVTAALKAISVLERTIVDLVQPVLLKDESLADVLLREGVVRVNHVMEAALCDRCLADLNSALAEKKSALLETSSSSSGGFGDIYSSNCRNDMYLRNEGSAAEALEFMLHSGTELADLFQACLPVGRPGVFHEFAALMTDSGAASQPVHPDSHYARFAPLWTVFVALQDVDIDMGPTIFLPKTHTAHPHECFTGGNERKEILLASSEYRRSVLKKGDCAVMDSRTLHFGDKNDSDGKRRVLLYFTIRNPLHSETGAEEDYPPCGSKWADLHMTTHDFL